MTKFIDGAGYSHDREKIIEMPNEAVILDSSASPILYVGTAAPGSSQDDAVWKIKKIDTTSGVIVYWADGNMNYDNVWTGHTGLSYS